MRINCCVFVSTGDRYKMTNSFEKKLLRLFVYLVSYSLQSISRNSHVRNGVSITIILWTHTVSSPNPAHTSYFSLSIMFFIQKMLTSYLNTLWNNCEDPICYYIILYDITRVCAEHNERFATIQSLSFVTVDTWQVGDRHIVTKYWTIVPERSSVHRYELSGIAAGAPSSAIDALELAVSKETRKSRLLREGSSNGQRTNFVIGTNTTGRQRTGHTSTASGHQPDLHCCWNVRCSAFRATVPLWLPAAAGCWPHNRRRRSRCRSRRS